MTTFSCAGFEHRLQMLGDQQLHSMPHDRDEKEDLAQRLGAPSAVALDADIEALRERVHLLFRSLVSSEQSETGRAHA